MEEVLVLLSKIDPTLGYELFRKVDKTFRLFDFKHSEMEEIALNPAKLEYLKRTYQKLGILISRIESMRKSSK